MSISNSISKFYRVLITGSKGYIGSALRLKLATIAKVIDYDLVDGYDIMNYSQLLSVMKESKPDVVIHLAALSSVTECNEKPKQAILTNGNGTINVLKAMKEAGCQNIIYSSTSSVYGKMINYPYNEIGTTHPCSDYGYTKLLGEYAIFNHFDLKDSVGNYLIFRMFNVVGTSGYPEIDNTVSAGYDRLFGALESGAVTIYGHDCSTIDGTCERDYVSLKDVCEAYFLGVKCLMSTQNKCRHVLNICTGEPTSVRQIVLEWNRIANKIASGHVNYTDCHELPTVIFTYGPKRLGDPERVFGSNRLAREIIKWSPKYTITDIIKNIAIDKYFDQCDEEVCYV